MEEIIYDTEEFLKSPSVDACPKIEVKIKVLELNKETDLNYSSLPKNFRKFFKDIKEDDILFLEYPMFLSTRSERTLYSQLICITNERTNISEDIQNTKLNRFWKLIKKFSILK